MGADGFLSSLSHTRERLSDSLENLRRAFLVAVENAVLGMPEVTLPVVPGMEGCHWPFRKANRPQWPKLVRMLLTGAPVEAKDAVDWLIDYSGPMQDSLRMVWSLASGGAAGLTMRKLDEGMLKGLPADVGVSVSDSPATEAARKAIMETIRDSCGAALSEALDVQARHSADFTVSSFCREGSIGAEHLRTMTV
jgi:enoyl-CoA hydratase/carnithine racemase